MVSTTGGAAAIAGLEYQKNYAAFRIFAAVAAKCYAYTGTHQIEHFSIEGSANDGPVWDVRLREQTGFVHLRECKDTALTAGDRRAFYRRVRKELSRGTSAAKCGIGWVLNPEKQDGNTVAHLAGIANLASTGTMPESAPLQVRSPADALREAMYYLTVDRECDSPACSFDDAQTVLRTLTIEEHHSDDLASAVAILATGVLATGTADALRNIGSGELANRVCTHGTAEYTCEAFLQAIGGASVSLQVQGREQALLRFNSGAGYIDSVPIIRWTRLAGEPETVWPLHERVTSLHTHRSCVVVAPMGVGKTVTSYQAFEDQRHIRDKHHVFRFDAGSLENDDLDAMVNVLCLLCGLSPTWIAIDGLDEISKNQQLLWKKTLQRLLRLPNLSVLLTARQEVAASDPWLQGLITRFSALTLEPLSVDQVKTAFRDVNLPVPANDSLLQVLRIPFFLEKYARIATPADLPLAESGEVTGFHVIKAFWQRAVYPESSGHRLVGDESLSQHLKQKALSHVVRQALQGAHVFQLDGCSREEAQGMEMLAREGVLLKRGTHAFVWFHDWVREFAIVDYVIGTVTPVDVPRLVDATTALEGDVGRTAAVGGLKWLLAHPEYGTPHRYVNELWKKNAGFAREVLAVIMEGSSHTVALSQLDRFILVEAIQIALILKAPQWRDQISSLPLSAFDGSEGAYLFSLVPLPAGKFRAGSRLVFKSYAAEG